MTTVKLFDTTNLEKMILSSKLNKRLVDNPQSLSRNEYKLICTTNVNTANYLKLNLEIQLYFMELHRISNDCYWYFKLSNKDNDKLNNAIENYELDCISDIYEVY